MLGHLLHEKPDELMADMRQVYGLDIRQWETDPLYYAALAYQLPPESRCLGGVSIVEILLCNIEYDARLLAWMQSKDGQRGRKRPERIDLYKNKPSNNLTEGKVSMTIDEYEAFMSEKRGGSDGERS